MRCAMTGREFTDPSDGIWDDGEWISWDYLGRQIYEQDRSAEFPAASQEMLDVFDNLVDAARDYKKSLAGTCLCSANWVSCMRKSSMASDVTRPEPKVLTENSGMISSRSKRSHQRSDCIK